MDSYLGAVPGAEDEERGLLLVVLIAFTYLFAFDCEALCVEQLFRFISQVTHEVELLQSCLRNNVGGSSSSGSGSRSFPRSSRRKPALVSVL